MPVCVLSHSAVSDCLGPYGLKTAKAPLSMGFFRQECWSWLPFPSPGDLSDPGIEPSPALADGFLTTEPPGKTLVKLYCILKILLDSIC